MTTIGWIRPRFASSGARACAHAPLWSGPCLASRAWWPGGEAPARARGQLCRAARARSQELGKELTDDEVKEAIKILAKNKNTIELDDFCAWWVIGTAARVVRLPKGSALRADAAQHHVRWCSTYLVRAPLDSCVAQVDQNSQRRARGGGVTVWRGPPRSVTARALYHSALYALASRCAGWVELQQELAPPHAAAQVSERLCDVILTSLYL
jgi:hypothetical protein